MVSKTRKQVQRKQQKMEENGGVMPSAIPTPKKSIHLKKTRPNMKGKMKIRLGLESPINVYEGFDEKKGVLWKCPQCGRACRVVGFCVDCVSGTKSKKHSGLTMTRGSMAKILTAKKKSSSETSTKGKKTAETQKKLKFKVKTGGKK